MDYSTAENPVACGQTTCLTRTDGLKTTLTRRYAEVLKESLCKSPYIRVILEDIGEFTEDVKLRK